MPAKVTALGCACVALFLATGCKKQPKPSEEFERAKTRYLKLMEEDSAGAVELPGMDIVLATLDQVDPKSDDYDQAMALKERINAARARLAEERENRKKIVADVEARAAMPPPDVPVASGPTEAPAQAAPAKPRIAYGTKLEQFKAAYGDCFEMKMPTTVVDPQGGPSVQGEAWALKDDAKCKSAHAAEADKYVIVADGMIVNVQATNTTKLEEHVTPAKPIAVPAILLPDGGIAPKTPLQ
jgi:hypothetical protein